MDDGLTVWKHVIISEAQDKLHRDLSTVEREFIECRFTYVGLEFIADTVRDLSGNELSDYLNSEEER